MNPVFQHISKLAQSTGQEAIITIPGLGCGQFAGPFRGQLGLKLKVAIKEILLSLAGELPGIRAVYYDPYSECENETDNIDGIEFLVRPLTKNNQGKSQLSKPSELSSHFEGCKLYSIVAWDHVSWPGNDYYIGARATDDGVKAAATDSMKCITGVEGTYDSNLSKYLPPKGYANWSQLINDKAITLQVKSRVSIY